MQIQLSDHFTYKRLMVFALPSILMMLFTSIYSVVDGLFVSNVVGESAFAAINLIMPYCMIFSSIGSVFGVGGSALVARIKGEGDQTRANQIFTLLVIVMLVLGLALTVVSELLLPGAARLMGATDQLMDHCLAYARIFLLAQSAFFLQYGLQPFMITAERPRLGLAFTVAAGLTNMVLDWLFIAVFHWGVAGAAVASCVGQCIGGFGPVIYFFRAKDCPLQFVKTYFMPRELLKSASNGSAEGITNVAMSLVNMIYIFQLMKYIGEYGVSAFGVIMYVNFIFQAFFIGYTMGTSPLFSFQYGAGRSQELKNLFQKSLILIIGFSVGLTLLALWSAGGIASFFASYDEEFMRITTRALRLYALSYFFAGINIFGSNLFAALNNGLVAGTLSGLRIFVFQLAAIFLLPLLLGSDGIWLSMFVAECCVLVITILAFCKGRKAYHYA